MSVILMAWQGKARAQRRRGTFHSGLKLKPDNDDSWKFATTSEDITIAVVSRANGLISLTNRASDQAHGSSIARTESKSSSLAVTSRVRMGSMPCSLEFTKTKNSSSWRK